MILADKCKGQKEVNGNQNYKFIKAIKMKKVLHLFVEWRMTLCHFTASVFVYAVLQINFLSGFVGEVTNTLISKYLKIKHIDGRRTYRLVI